MESELKIAHVSSAHPSMDQRVRLKEIDGLANVGMKVIFVTGDLTAKSSNNSNLKVIRVKPGKQSRYLRMFLTAPLAAFIAFRQEADIYHFHDPELIPWMYLIAVLTSKPVVYDVHEDYYSSIMQKRWIPNVLRSKAAFLFERFESIVSSKFSIVIAEKYYNQRFPKSVEVLNYPVVRFHYEKPVYSPKKIELLYTGNITEDRGALLMAELVRDNKDITVTCVGFCLSTLYKRMMDVAGENSCNLQVVGVDQFVTHDRIVEFYRSGKWVAGLALFPDSMHYREKHLTKFFEYMSYGIPIIASDFPVWRDLIEKQGVGICVNSLDSIAASKAARELYLNSLLAKKIGETGIELAHSKYTWQSQFDNLLALYSSLGQSSSRAG